MESNGSLLHVQPSVKSKGKVKKKKKSEDTSREIVVEDAASDEEKLKAAKEAIYADAGRSQVVLPSSSQSENDAPKSEVAPKSSSGFMKFLKMIRDWIQRQVEAFVAKFTPQDKMIVKQTA